MEMPIYHSWKRNKGEESSKVIQLPIRFGQRQGMHPQTRKRRTWKSGQKEKMFRHPERSDDFGDFLIILLSHQMMPLVMENLMRDAVFFDLVFSINC